MERKTTGPPQVQGTPAKVQRPKRPRLETGRKIKLEQPSKNPAKQTK